MRIQFPRSGFVHETRLKRKKKLMFYFIVAVACLSSSFCIHRSTTAESSVDTASPIARFFEKYGDKEILIKNFAVALRNQSESPSFVVFSAQDMDSGIVREICCEAPLLRIAMRFEHRVRSGGEEDDTIDCMMLDTFPKPFRFRSQDALGAIRFYDYPGSGMIIDTVRKMNLDQFFEKYQGNNRYDGFYFEPERKMEQLTMAHIMFRMGILTRLEHTPSGDMLSFGHPERPLPFYREDRLYQEWRTKIISAERNQRTHTKEPHKPDRNRP